MIGLNKFIKRREKNGMPSGTPIYTGEKKEEQDAPI